MVGCVKPAMGASVRQRRRALHRNQLLPVARLAYRAYFEETVDSPGQTLSRSWGQTLARRCTIQNIWSGLHDCRHSLQQVSAADAVQFRSAHAVDVAQQSAKC